MSLRETCTKVEKSQPKTRPKSFPNKEILSSGSSDSGLESENTSMVVTLNGGDLGSDSHQALPEFQFGGNKTHKERMNNLRNALNWVRTELTEMKSQDKHLARTMIDLRSKIQQLKLEFESCNDNGYGSDADEPTEGDSHSGARSQENILNYQYKALNGEAFESNKRATWAM